MNANWLQKYPKVAALLQGDDDVLDYAPDEEEPTRTLLCAALIMGAVVERVTQGMDTELLGLAVGQATMPAPQPLRQGDTYIIPGLVGTDRRYQLFPWDPPDHRQARAMCPWSDPEARAALEAFLLAHGAVSLPLMVVPRELRRWCHMRHDGARQIVAYGLWPCETHIPAAVCTCGMYALRWEA